MTTLFWTGTGDHLGHEYQFNFGLPQARTAFTRTLAFLATATGYGTVGVSDGKPFVQVVSGTIPFKSIRYQPRPLG